MLFHVKKLLRVRLVTGIGQAICQKHQQPKRSIVTWSMLNCVHKKFPVCSVPRHFYSTDSNDVLSVENTKLRQYLKHLEQKFEDAERRIMLHEETMDADELRSVHTTITTLGPVVYKFRNYYTKHKELKEFEDMIQDLEAKGDKETAAIARLEQAESEEHTRVLEQDLLDDLLPVERADDLDAIFEVSAGVGGQEAMIFTSEMFTMYEKFSRYIGWDFDVISLDENETGHVRKASALIKGEKVYSVLKYEGGVHRVQRVPKTEKSGRVHTSTMSVAVLPRPTEVDVEIAEGDVEIDTFCASGPGGQHVNRTQSAVRVRHLPSGIAVACQESRSQLKNRDLAMQMLRSKLYEMESEKVNQNRRSQRKLQVGSRSRSEKIRTYNFLQDRVTDHRIGLSLGNIRGFMDGGEQLEELLIQLQEEDRKERLMELLDQFLEEEERERQV